MENNQQLDSEFFTHVINEPTIDKDKFPAGMA